MNCLKKKIISFCQQIAWCTSDIFKIWIKEIYLKYQNKIKNKCLLILDQAPSHKTDEIIQFMYNNNAEYKLYFILKICLKELKSQLVKIF